MSAIPLRAWISRLLDDGRRNGTITEAFKVLSGALNLAVDDGLIPATRPPPAGAHQVRRARRRAHAHLDGG